MVEPPAPPRLVTRRRNRLYRAVFSSETIGHISMQILDLALVLICFICMIIQSIKVLILTTESQILAGVILGWITVVFNYVKIVMMYSVFKGPRRSTRTVFRVMGFGLI
jgi:hypothetical protein